ncbi:MAG: nicotinamide mononucleotide transporter [Burkholderiales bacterium]|nr:nicotinamide mononucleotide transporter [Burkholderiales bacterium]
MIELVAFALALGYVLLSIRQRPIAWPLMIAASTLYGLLFLASRLYGQALLQLGFIAIAAWGWLQWTHGRKDDRPLAVSTLRLPQRLLLVVACGVATVLAALLLGRGTDAASPWLDAFTTVGSLLAQVLTARKYTDAWIGWLVVNLVSVALFLQQQLMPTALLYAIMAALSVAGWWAWRRAAAVPSGA